MGISIEEEKKNVPRGLSAMPRDYIHVHDHNILTSSALKPLGQSKILYVEHR